MSTADKAKFFEQQARKNAGGNKGPPATKAGRLASKFEQKIAKESREAESQRVKGARGAARPAASATGTAPKSPRSIGVKSPRREAVKSAAKSNPFMKSLDSRWGDMTPEEKKKIDEIFAANSQGDTMTIVQFETAVSDEWFDYSQENAWRLLKMMHKDASENLTREEFRAVGAYITSVINAFLQFDEDDSGEIDYDELHKALSVLGYKFNDEQFDDIFAFIDVDRSEVIDYEEFNAFVLFMRLVADLFKEADTDGNGDLSYEELVKILPQLKISTENETEVRALFDQLDVDGSGDLCFEEFVNLIIGVKRKEAENEPEVEGNEWEFEPIDSDEEIESDDEEEDEEDEDIEAVGLKKNPFMGETTQFESLTEKERETIDQVFAEHVHGKEYLSVAEFEEALSHDFFQFSQDNAWRTLKIMGKSQEDGEISLEEFRGATAFLVVIINAFEEFDADDSGEIDLDEFTTALEKLGYKFTKDQVQDIYVFVDADESGSVDYDEFNSFVLFMRYARELFLQADADGNGTVSLTELEMILPTLKLVGKSKAQVQRLFYMLDLDQSGDLSFEEFVSLVLESKLQQLAREPLRQLNEWELVDEEELEEAYGEEGEEDEEYDDDEEEEEEEEEGEEEEGEEGEKEANAEE